MLRHLLLLGFADLALCRCLDNARFQASERRNVILAGNSSPLQFATAGWATSNLMSFAFKIIVEEMLGYNTSHALTCDTSVACLYMIAGCKAWRQFVDDPNCLDPWPPEAHIVIGPWLHQQGSDAEYFIRKNYPNTYPINLGSVGYTGYEAIFGAGRSYAQAITQEHLPLDFYLSYSHPRISLTPFFDRPESIDPHDLLFCNQTLLNTDLEMRRYVNATQDYGGVFEEPLPGGGTKLTGVCEDGHWWLSPACRVNRSRCIPFITGGYGWSLDTMIQRAALWDMPVAAAVVKDWDRYASIPRHFRVLVGWWFPGDAFLELDPFAVTFPVTSEREWDRGLMRTSNPHVQIMKWGFFAIKNTSSDFGAIPEVLSRFRVTREDISDLLQINQEKQDYEESACAWLRSIGGRWMDWIPLDSSCRKGQGMISKSGTFVDSRESAVGCQWCPAGRMSVPFQDSSGDSHRCDLCQNGTFQPGLGMTLCEPCDPGSAAPKAGLQACERCTFGRFAELTGQTACTDCPAEFVTAFVGAEDINSCICAEGTYRDAADRERCLPCKVGMICPFGSDALAYTDKADSDTQTIPLLREGYWSSATEPLSVYRCDDEVRCPGSRRPGLACPVTSESQACSQCPEKQFWDGERCSVCPASSGSPLFFPIVPLVLFPLFVMWQYKFSRDTYEKWGSWQNGVLTIVFILLTHYHSLNVLQSVDLMVPSTSVMHTLEQFEFASNLFVIFNLQCSNSVNSFQRRLLLRALGPAYVIGVYVVEWLVSNLVGLRYPGLAMDRDLMISDCMSLIFTFFAGIANMGFTLFVCSQNPNGLHTLLEERSITCFEDEWVALSLIGILAILFWCVGLGLLFASAVWTAPATFYKESTQKRWRFLFMCYRPDTHWWPLIFVLKSVLLSVPAMVTPSAIGQVHWIMAVLIGYTCLELVVRPWRHLANSIVDGWLHMCLMMVCLALVAFGRRTADKEEMSSQWGEILVTLAGYGACIPALPAGCWMVYRQRSLRAQLHREMDLGLIFDSAESMVQAGRHSMCERLLRLPESDWRMMVRFKNVMQTEMLGRRCRLGYSTKQLLLLSEQEIDTIVTHGLQSFRGSVCHTPSAVQDFKEVCENILRPGFARTSMMKRVSSLGSHRASPPGRVRDSLVDVGNVKTVEL